MVQPRFLQGGAPREIDRRAQADTQLLGQVQRVRICKLNDPWTGELELVGESDKRMRVSVRLETGAMSRFNYVLFGPVDMADDTWEKLNTDLDKLPGKNAASVWKLTPTVTKVFSRRSTEPLAVGSSLKLLILSLLCDDISSGKRQVD